MRSRSFVFLLALALLLPAAGALAAPQDINVVQAWDGGGLASGSWFIFPTTGTGIADSRRFRIDNTGDATLTISNANSLVSGTCFSQIETPSSSLGGHTSTYFRVRVFCTQAGDYFGQVTINSNDPDENPYVIYLQARVEGPEISVWHNWENVEQPDGSQFSFGQVKTGTPVSFRFEIRNTGNGTLTISNPGSIVSGTGFSLIETPSSSVPPGGSTFFRVRFYTTTSGNYLGHVTINNNDADESTYDIVLGATASDFLP